MPGNDWSDIDFDLNLDYGEPPARPARRGRAVIGVLLGVLLLGGAAAFWLWWKPATPLPPGMTISSGATVTVVSPVPVTTTQTVTPTVADTATEVVMPVETTQSPTTARPPQSTTRPATTQANNPLATQPPAGGKVALTGLSCTRDGGDFTFTVSFTTGGQPGTLTVKVGAVSTSIPVQASWSSASGKANGPASPQTCTATIRTSAGTDSRNTTSN